MRARRLLSILLALAVVFTLLPAAAVPAKAADDVPINATNFPDAVFREYVKKTIDDDGNNVLSPQEIAAAKIIVLANEDVTNMKGIELFTELTDLTIPHNGDLQTDTLDLTHNTKLEKLLCQNCGLTKLNLTKNTALKELDCSENKLTTLNLSKNKALEEVKCYSNQLTSLNVSGCVKLELLDCSDNSLSALDVRQNTELDWLDCCQNEISVLDIGCCPELIEVYKTGYEDHSSVWIGFSDYGDDWLWGDEGAAFLRYDLSAKLETYTHPTILTQPKSVAVLEGETAKFTVKAVGTSFTYQWYYKAPGSGTWAKVSAASGKTATYKLTAKAKHDGYQYYCVLQETEDDNYASTEIVTLTICTKPAITKHPAAKTVAVGKTATFKVTATGGALNYQWYYKKPGDTSWTKVSKDGNSATYSLTTKERHNGYKYCCRVWNAAGSVYTKTVTLTVVCSKPVITTQPPKAVTVDAGQKAVFTIAASGEALSYQWQYKKPGATSWTNVSKNGTSPTYTLTTQARHNGYVYRCRVKNLMGSVYTSTVKLNVE